MKAAAERAGMQPTAFLKLAGLAVIHKEAVVPPAIEEALRSVTLELRRIGTNVNQLARKANTLQRLTHPEIREMKKNLVEMETVIHQFVFNPSRHGHQVA